MGLSLHTRPGVNQSHPCGRQRSGLPSARRRRPPALQCWSSSRANASLIMSFVIVDRRLEAVSEAQPSLRTCEKMTVAAARCEDSARLGRDYGELTALGIPGLKSWAIFGGPYGTGRKRFAHIFFATPCIAEDGTGPGVAAHCW